MSGVVCIDDLERSAATLLDANARGYYNNGADDKQTLRENVTAFQRYHLRPRAMVDVSSIDLTQTVLGHRVTMPIGVAPTGMHKLAHPHGECASARAAEEMGSVFILSHMSNCSLEEVAQAAPRAIKWFQLQIFQDRELTRGIVLRAESAGFSALVLTVDQPLFRMRLSDTKNKFLMPLDLSLGNYTAEVSQGSIHDFLASQFDPSLTWSDLSWLRSITRLPVLVKGVMTADDALLAIQHGAAGVIVSNHGGRELDGSRAAVDALRPVVTAVAGRCPVLVDGGVRRGTDVLKALALGASMVFVGRPLLWGLAHDGQRGARLALQLLQHELRMALGGCGVAKVANVTEKVIDQSEQSRL